MQQSCLSLPKKNDLFHGPRKDASKDMDVRLSWVDKDDPLKVRIVSVRCGSDYQAAGCTDSSLISLYELEFNVHSSVGTNIKAFAAAGRGSSCDSTKCKENWLVHVVNPGVSNVIVNALVMTYHASQSVGMSYHF